MKRVGQAIEARTPVRGVILFRTYNPDARCGHADAETVLVIEAYVDEICGRCRRCLTEELTRRKIAAVDAGQ